MKIDKTKTSSIRKAFGKTLTEIGELNERVVVMDADLACSTQTQMFANKYPDRFFDCGIAEQDMVATAAGLASEGKIPFVASFAMFATGRTYDQIRNAVCYPNFNVKIVGTHGGVTVGEDGATHQALEDVSLMRGLPNMTVIVPGDSNECEQALEFALEQDGPVYIRVSRNNLPNVYSSEYKFNPYKAVKLREGSDLTIISNGDVLSEAYKASEMLAEKGVEAEVLSIPVVKPLDAQSVIESATKTGFVVTVENHSIYGGIGSAVCEVLSEKLPTKTLRIGVEDKFGQSGTPNELLKHYNLDAESIVNKVLKSL
jgi:transketolase